MTTKRQLLKLSKLAALLLSETSIVAYVGLVGQLVSANIQVRINIYIPHVWHGPRLVPEFYSRKGDLVHRFKTMHEVPRSSFAEFSTPFCDPLPKR